MLLITDYHQVKDTYEEAVELRVALPVFCAEDHTDNLFAEPISHFAEIEEGQPPAYLLSSEYAKTL